MTEIRDRKECQTREEAENFQRILKRVDICHVKGCGNEANVTMVILHGLRVRLCPSHALRLGADVDLPDLQKGRGWVEHS